MEFGEFKVKEGVYIPDVGIDYPTDDPHRRLLAVEVEDSSKGRYQFDETYPYLDDSFKHMLNTIAGWFVKWCLVGVHNRCHYGLQIKGARKLRRMKEKLRDGAVCVCNHVFVFDALGVNAACQKFRQVRIPMFAKHFNGHGRWILQQAGGIPIPETREGIRKYNEAFDEFARRKFWFIIFPEAVRWNMYVPIRPFKRGAFSMAYKYDRPVIPFVYTYRERKGIYRLFGKKNDPCVTLHVGDPIWFDKSANRKQELDRVCREAHAAMVEMAGIEVNPWPASDEE